MEHDRLWPVLVLSFLLGGAAPICSQRTILTLILPPFRLLFPCLRFPPFPLPSPSCPLYRTSVLACSLSRILHRSFRVEPRLISQAERELARQIAVKLGFLPLAIAQAGSYISQMQISFHKYMTLLDASFKTVATRGTKNPNRSIFTTWELSFAQLSQPAQELLLLCAFLVNSDIPDKLFQVVRGRKLPFDWVPVDEGKGNLNALRPRFLPADFKQETCG
jgi:hypothetical protein